MKFFEKLDLEIAKKSPICVGLDPHFDFLPREILEKNFKKHGENPRGAAAAILEFNLEIIDAIYDLVPAVKPQIAFYEKWGSEGILALEQTISYAKKLGLLVIMDAKRNDIGSTAQAYAEAFFEKDSDLRVDALTVTPYFGSEGVLPFLEIAHKNNCGIFLVAFTSNKGANEIQEPIKDSLIEKINNFHLDFGNLGAVVGLTRNDLVELRKKMKDVFFLVPGFGAQGGSPENIKKVFFDNKKALISASRSVIFAYKDRNDKDFKKSARKEVERMKKELVTLEI